MAALGFLNKILGSLFGGLKIAIILGAVLVFFDRTNNSIGFIDEKTIDTSVLYLPIRDLGAFVFSLVLKDRHIEDEKNTFNNVTFIYKK